MVKEEIPWSDPYILLSWLNMKLRDECSDLKELCERYEIQIEDVTERMKSIGYKFEDKTNQFISNEL